MHLSPTVRRLVACVLFVAYATFGVCGVGLVRCQEADGSVNMEWRGSACCTQDASLEPAHADESVGTDASDGCGGCVDESLAGGFASTRATTSRGARDVVPDASTPTPPLLLVATRMLLGDPWERPTTRLRAPVRPPPPAALRTLVLRC